MTPKEKKDLITTGLIIPWLIVIGTSIFAFNTCKSRKSLKQDLRTSMHEQKETKKALAEVRKELKDYKKEALPITDSPPKKKLPPKRWRSSQGGIVIIYTLINKAGKLNLKRSFHDGGSLDCYVTQKTISGQTVLRPITPIESGDYWIISGSKLKCMDSIGHIVTAQPTK